MARLCRVLGPEVACEESVGCCRCEGLEVCSDCELVGFGV